MTSSTTLNTADDRSPYIYRDRIFEYHVVAPMVLQSLDQTHPNSIPSSQMYDLINDVAHKNSIAGDYWNDLCEHDKVWLMQNMVQLIIMSDLDDRLLDDAEDMFNTMMDMTQPLDQLIPHDEWLELARHAADTRWDGSPTYDKFLEHYHLPSTALTMAHVFNDTMDFDDAWRDLLFDYDYEARQGHTIPYEAVKPDWYDELRSRSEEDPWFIERDNKVEAEQVDDNATSYSDVAGAPASPADWEDDSSIASGYRESTVDESVQTPC